MLAAGDERHDAEGQQRELRIEVQQHADRPDQHQAGLEQRHHRVGDEAFQGLHVVGDPRDQHPRGAALVEADRLALQVGEDANPQVREGALADPPDEVGLGARGGPHEHRRDQEGDHRQHQHFGFVMFDALVDREPRQQRRCQRRARPQHQREQHRRHAQAVGAQQRQQAAKVASAAAAGGAIAVPLAGAGDTGTEPHPAAALAAAPAGAHGAHRSPPASTPRLSASGAPTSSGCGVGGHDLAIQGRALEQLRVLSPRNQAPVVEHHDLIRQRDRREAVGDHERRASRHRLRRERA